MSRKHPPFLETSKNSHGKWFGCHPLNTVVFFSNFSKLLKVIPKLVWVSCGGHQKKCIVREHRSSNSDHCWSFPDANPTTQVAGHQNRHFCNDGSLRSLLAVLDDRRRTIERRVLREICYFYSVGNVTAKIFRMRGCGVIPPPTVAIMEESFIFTYFFLRVLMPSLSIDIHCPLDRKGSWSFIGPSLLEVYGMLVWRDLWGAQCLASSHHAFLLVEHQTTSAIAPSFLVLEKMTDVFFFSKFCVDHSNSKVAVIKCTACIFHPASDSPLFFLFRQFMYLGFSPRRNFEMKHRIVFFKMLLCYLIFSNLWM